MPRSLLSSRYNFACLKAKTKMSVSFAKASKCTRIWDPLKREIKTRSVMKNSKDYRGRLQSHQLSLLQSNDWLTSDLVPFTVRYELEKRHNIELMAHYGDDEDTTVESISTDEDSNDENEYFHSKPRRINFNDPEFGNESMDGDDAKEEATVPKQKRKKLLGDEVNRKFACDVCKKFFEKRWALNSHMLSHSGDKPFRCTYTTCTKQYADRSNLRAHQRSKMHHAWKIFCKQCTKPFSEQRYLNLHSLSACRKYLASVSKKTFP